MKTIIRTVYLMAISVILCSITTYAQSNGGNPCLDVVVIDPGHGGKDPGALGLGKASCVPEKTVVLKISKLLGEKIEKAYPEVKVCYTRDSDVFIGLSDRARIAKKNNADLFISIHCNSNNNRSACGTSVHILGQRSDNARNTKDYFAQSQSVAQRENDVVVLEDDYQVKYAHLDPNLPESYIGNLLQWKAYYESSLLFATEVIDHLIKAPLKKRNIVLDQDVFTVLAEARMPAVLLELAFISNEKEYEYLTSTSGQEEIAERLFKAFAEYKSKYDSSMNITTSAPDLSSLVEDGIEETEPAAQELSNVYYGIQIMSGSRNLKNGDPAFKGLDAASVKIDGSNLYKYIVGKFTTKEEAQAALSGVRKKFSDAFVVKVQDGKVSRP